LYNEERMNTDKKTLFTKMLLGFIIVILFSSICSAKEIRINLQNNFGYNAINLETLLGSPYYDPDLSKYLTQIYDWDTFFYKGVIQVFFPLRDNLAIGGEAGINHLYFCEERYYDPSYGLRYRSWDIWTLQAGAVLEYTIDKLVFLQTGLSLHNFYTTGGTTIAVMAAAGYQYEPSFISTFTVPLQFRIDMVFGDVLSFAVSGGIGIQFHIEQDTRS